MNNVIIVGSGLAGPLLAILLSKRSESITLFEKREDIRKQSFYGGRSINLALSHRGIEALKDAGVYDCIKNELLPMEGRLIHDKNGNTNFQPYSINPKEVIYSVSRSRLNKILLNEADKKNNVKIVFEHNLSKIEDDKLIFNNNINYDCKNSLVFGADCIKSKVREYVDSKVEKTSYIKPLGHSYKELNISSSENGNFKLKPNVLHIWPRNEFMLIALPNPDKSLTCTLFLPNDGKNSFKNLNTKSKVKNFFENYFSDVFDKIDNCIDSFFTNPTSKLGSVINYNLSYNNQFCLMGDAAYAIVPFYGQGMNASFEDCSILVSYLKNNNNNWLDAIEKFSIDRLKDRKSISIMALENYIEMRDSVANDVFLKKREIANILFENFPNQFIPKYNMVSFTSISYNEVNKRAIIQEKILDKLIDNFSLERANKLISKSLSNIL